MKNLSWCHISMPVAHKYSWIVKYRCRYILMVISHWEGLFSLLYAYQCYYRIGVYGHIFPSVSDVLKYNDATPPLVWDYIARPDHFSTIDGRWSSAFSTPRIQTRLQKIFWRNVSRSMPTSTVKCNAVPWTCGTIYFLDALMSYSLLR